GPLDKYLKAARLYPLKSRPPSGRGIRTTSPGAPSPEQEVCKPMEPVSVPAARGTLADPEVLQNVPGHIIPILQREYDDFKTEATKFLDGQTEEDTFIKFRLKQGVYGQRQADVQ